MKKRHGGPIDLSLQPGPDDHIRFMIPKSFDESRRLPEIVSPVRVTHDDVPSPRGLNSRKKGTSVPPFLNAYDPCAILSGDLARPIRRPAICGDDLASGAKPSDRFLDIAQGDRHSIFFVRPREPNRKFD